jgi:hypothetical protein
MPGILAGKKPGQVQRRSGSLQNANLHDSHHQRMITSHGRCLTKRRNSNRSGRKKEILQCNHFVGVIGVSIPNAIPNRPLLESLNAHFIIDSIDDK